jgi:hypothetical protein
MRWGEQEDGASEGRMEMDGAGAVGCAYSPYGLRLMHGRTSAGTRSSAQDASASTRAEGCSANGLGKG